MAARSTVGVTMSFDFGSNPPADIMSIRRIDGEGLASGRATVNHGTLTTRWDVVSPTIRPVAFALTITEDTSGKTLLNRSQERTGADGKGAGADEFTV